MSAELAPFGDYERESVPYCSLNFSLQLAILGIFWLTDASLESLPPLPMLFSALVSSHHQLLGAPDPLDSRPILLEYDFILS